MVYNTLDMIVLAIDSALDACSAAVWRDGGVPARIVRPGARDQAENLVPIVQETMREAGVDWRDLDRIAVTVGPGSFTGLRVGLAAARGFALAAAKPAVGVTTFVALAATAAEAGAVAVAIDAGRGEVYFQVFDAALAPLDPPRSLAATEAANAIPPGICLVGSGADLVRRAASGRGDLRCRPDLIHPDPAMVAALGARAELPPDGAPPSPLYIHPPRIVLPGGAALRP